MKANVFLREGKMILRKKNVVNVEKADAYQRGASAFVFVDVEVAYSLLFA